jgi:hypothetical protein
MKVHKGDLVHIDDTRADRHQTDLNIYGKTLMGDFKAIRRNLSRRYLGSRGRLWFAHLAKVTSITDVITVLDLGGERARRAWLLHVWWRQVNDREFNPKVGLHTRPMRYAVDVDIPLWVADLRSERTSPGQDAVHLWIARWISAAGLLALWHCICWTAKDTSLADLQVLDKALLSMPNEPAWSLGIGLRDELILCLDYCAKRLVIT